VWSSDYATVQLFLVKSELEKCGRKIRRDNLSYCASISQHTPTITSMICQSVRTVSGPAFEPGSPWIWIRIAEYWPRFSLPAHVL